MSTGLEDDKVAGVTVELPLLLKVFQSVEDSQPDEDAPAWVMDMLVAENTAWEPPVMMSGAETVISAWVKLRVTF